jgi:hypothetical protein
MEDYGRKISARTIIIIILSIIILPSGYLAIYYVQCMGGPIKILENKYNKKKLAETCQWSEQKTYLQCMKKDYLKVLRSTGPFDSHLAFLFEKELFRLDRDKQSTDLGKVNNVVDHLELGVNFLIIRGNVRVKRTNLHLAGFLLAYVTRGQVLEEFIKFNSYIELVETKYKNALETDKVLNQRFNFVKREFKKYESKLADLK